MSEVLKAQQRTNQNLEEQFKELTKHRYDGTDPDISDDWLYQIESL